MCPHAEDVWEQMVMTAVGSEHNETKVKVKSPPLSAYIPFTYQKEKCTHIFNKLHFAKK